MNEDELYDRLNRLESVLARVADAMERATGTSMIEPNLSQADGYVFDPANAAIVPVETINRVEFTLIRGVDRVRDQLLENTQRFANDLPANNVLLWGARGMGKSSLVKAVHAKVLNETRAPLKLIEIHREDIQALPRLLSAVRSCPQKIILFCDDLSFDKDDTAYKSLKAALDGGVEGRPANVIFYATSNRRHLLPRGMIENERSTAINPAEAVEEKVSLSDRFGLWLGFHKCSQDEYLEMISAYSAHFALGVEPETLRRDALEWATTRGARSGRVAWQFTVDLAGRLGKKLH
ncbi:MAG: ATP-binding protein [Pseudomonadota bacterium]